MNNMHSNDKKAMFFIQKKVNYQVQKIKVANLTAVYFVSLISTFQNKSSAGTNNLLPFLKFPKIKIDY